MNSKYAQTNRSLDIFKENIGHEEKNRLVKHKNSKVGCTFNPYISTNAHGIYSREVKLCLISNYTPCGGKVPPANMKYVLKYLCVFFTFCTPIKQ